MGRGHLPKRRREGGSLGGQRWWAKWYLSGGGHILTRCLLGGRRGVVRGDGQAWRCTCSMFGQSFVSRCGSPRHIVFGCRLGEVIIASLMTARTDMLHRIIEDVDCSTNGAPDTGGGTSGSPDRPRPTQSDVERLAAAPEDEWIRESGILVRRCNKAMSRMLRWVGSPSQEQRWRRPGSRAFWMGRKGVRAHCRPVAPVKWGSTLSNETFHPCVCVCC